MLKPSRGLRQSAIDTFLNILHLQGAVMCSYRAFFASLQSYVAKACGLKWLGKSCVPSATQRVQVTRKEERGIFREAYMKILGVIEVCQVVQTKVGLIT